MKMKILSPVGDLESLKMAIFNGADEIYLGVKDFNARNIEGFSLETLKIAVDFAHIYDVKVFLTVNILFKDEEMQSVVDLIVESANFGVDAFIIQDVGLASLLHEFYPNIEIHASTQMGIHNLEGVKEIEKLGFKRVCLARETPLDEIKRINENSDIEIEYFVQGALCVCFSGNCYMSSYLFDASGNRGKCKQLCRLPYDLRFNNKMIKHGYLLSAKDFNMIDRLDDLKMAGVESLKIEGRARRPYYVGVATNMYRKAIDGDVVDKHEIELAFNRRYTEGYFNGNSNIISNIQNHIGVEIGKVEKFKKGKKFNEIYISSDRELNKKSSFKFFRNGEEVAVITAFDLGHKDNLWKITSTTEVKVGDKVHLIVDYEKENEMLNKTKKVKIDLDLTFNQSEPMKAEFDICGKHFVVEGERSESAKTAPITPEDVITCFQKSEYFAPTINLKMDNIFVPRKILNEFRRKVYEIIKNEKINKNLKNYEKIQLKSVKNNKFINNFENLFIKTENYQIIEDKNQKKLKDIIIYSPEEYIEKDILEAKEFIEKENKKFILELPNFALKNDVEYLKNIVEKNKISIVINNFYALSFDTKKYIGWGMNVYNSYSANYFSLPYIQAENGQESAPYMTLRHCPMKEHLNANCSNCPYKQGYEYVLDSGKRFQLKRKKLSTCTFYLVKGTDKTCM